MRHEFNHPFHDGTDNGLLIPVAHRAGNGGVENTMQAIYAAYDAGFRYAEIDVTCTNDLVPVLYHGDGEAQNIIKGLDYADLNRNETWDKIGFRGSRENPIPRLDDVLSSFPDMKFFLDQKIDEVSASVARAIMQQDAYGRVSIDGENWSRTCATIKELPKNKRDEVARTLGPLGLFSLYGEANDVPSWQQFKNRYLMKATNLSLPIGAVNERMVEIAHDVNKPVFLYRVNSIADMQKARRLGAYGVMMDDLYLKNWA